MLAVNLVKQNSEMKPGEDHSVNKSTWMIFYNKTDSLTTLGELDSQGSIRRSYSPFSSLNYGPICTLSSGKSDYKNYKEYCPFPRMGRIDKDLLYGWSPIGQGCVSQIN